MRELRLVVEPDDSSHVRRPRTRAEKLLRARNANVDKVRVRGQPDLRAKRSAQLILVEPGVRCESVQRDALGVSFTEELSCASYGAGSAGTRLRNRRERCNRLGDGDLDGENLSTRRKRIEELMECNSATISRLEMTRVLATLHVDMA